MIHYTCDRCKRQINTADQTRYIVQIDIQTASEEMGVEIEDDIDQLTELHQMLEGMTTDPIDMSDDDASSHHGRYDLCPECHRQFLKNPLGRDAVLALGFSNN
ncbi:MAG: hypothetical protein AB8B91_23895 [Rubripirellula sp.]